MKLNNPICARVLSKAVSQLPHVRDDRYDHGSFYKVPYAQMELVIDPNAYPEPTSCIRELTFQKDERLGDWVLIDVK